MRRSLAWLAVLGMLGTLAGCYKGRGVCDCLDYSDPCCYYGGPYGYAPSPHMQQDHLAPVPSVPPPILTPVEPLKIIPKQTEPSSPAKDPAKEKTSPEI